MKQRSGEEKEKRKMVLKVTAKIKQGTSKIIYRRKKGCRVAYDPNVVGPELHRLATEMNGITPLDVVIAATEKSSPLHEYYEWDEARAGHMYRESQARHMMRCIEIVLVDRKSGEEKPVRSIIHIDMSREKRRELNEETGRSFTGKFHPINEVVKDVDMAEQTIERAKQDLLAWKRKYELYKEVFPNFKSKFRGVFKALEGL